MQSWDSDIFVLDATAFFQGFQLRSHKKCVTTELIIKEVSHVKKDYFPIDFLLEAKKLDIATPKQESVNYVTSAAERIGDSGMSTSDISILALALDYTATVVSDDNRVCNLARILSIPFLALSGKRIKATRKWVTFCRECEKEYSANQRTCSVCGSTLVVRYRDRNSRDGLN